MKSAGRVVRFRMPRYVVRTLVAAALAGFSAPAAQAAAPGTGSADTIFVGGAIVTVNPTALQITMEAFAPGSGKDCAHPGGSLLLLPAVQFSPDAHFSDFSNSSGTLGYTLMFNADGGLVNGTVVSISMIHADKIATAKIYPAIGQIRVQ